MKKIVGIIAAVAMAASVFAVDFTAGTRLNGDLFNYNGTTKEMKLMSINNENQFWHKPIVFSVSGDNAGATVKFCEGDKDTMKAGKWAIWFKPVDMVKVDLGTIDASMNTESIDWGGRVLNYDSFGYRATVSVDALSIAVALVPGNNAYWFNNADVAKITAANAAYDEAYKAYLKANAVDKDDPTAAEKTAAVAAGNAAKEAALAADGYESAIAETNVKVDYNAGDAGTFTAMYDYSKAGKDGVSKIAVGYKNTFGDVTIFTDALYDLTKDANKYAVDFDAAYSADGISAQVYTKYAAPTKDANKGNQKLTVIAKASYAMDGITPYIYFKSDDLMVDGDIEMTVKPGVTGSVGIMSYEVAAKFDIAKKVNISVPVNFAVAF